MNHHLLRNIITITITSSSTITKQRFLPLPIQTRSEFEFPHKPPDFTFQGNWILFSVCISLPRTLTHSTSLPRTRLNTLSASYTASTYVYNHNCCFHEAGTHLTFPRNPFSHFPRIWSSKSSNRAQMETAENSHSVVFPEVVVGIPESLEKKKAAIRLDGPSKLQVIADFDGTLTKYWINGRRGSSSHGLLKQGNPVYDIKRKELHDYYQPLEFSPTIPIEEKTRLMEEWWGKTHALLIEGGLTYDSIKRSVANAVIAFREGVTELFEFLEEREVPVLIFSAGLADIIEEVFGQKLHRPFKNVKIVSNRMMFDDSGNLVAFKGKTIHVLNKNEHALDMAAPDHDQYGGIDEPSEDNAAVKKRTNVLLMGDHLGDLRMSDGLNYDNRIAVGFLNDNIENSLKSYRESFDIVYLNDAPMSGVLDLVSELCPSN